MLPSISVILNAGKKDKNGLSFILLRVIYKRKIYHKTTGFKVLPEEFENGLIRNSIDNATYKNRSIRKQLTDLERKLLELEDSGKLTPDNIKSVTSGEKGNSGNLLDVLTKVIDHYQGIMKKTHIKHWSTAKNKFDEFKPGLQVTELTPPVMKDFERHMAVKLGNHRNTVAGDGKRLVSMLRKAKELEFIKSYPLEEYTPQTYIETKRDYLVKEELAKVEKFIKDSQNEYLRNVATWFVFACYSGLRYMDLVKWDKSNVRAGRLYFSDDKTSNPHFIPIGAKLKQYIALVNDLPPVYTNQVMNRILKEIGGISGVERPLTMHVARHTFAVMYLDAGGSIEVLQKLMGHKKIATTQVYGKITDKRVTDEALKVFRKR